MKVNIAAQTLSSSVADALNFLMKAGVPGYADATDVIMLISMILFSFLNFLKLEV